MSKKNRHDTKIENEEIIEELDESLAANDEKSKNPELEERIAELEADNEKLKNDYYKVFAETENAKKRMQRELDGSLKYRIQSFATSILPAIDNLERALSSAGDEDPMKKGVEMIYNQIMAALSSEGVDVIDALDKPFDANFHQAIMTEKVDGVPSNTVVEVLQKGYMLKDRILRPSYVKVSE